jgi:threonine/homoserine/homoserine lactone efflux protein
MKRSILFFFAFLASFQLSSKTEAWLGLSPESMWTMVVNMATCVIAVHFGSHFADLARDAAKWRALMKPEDSQ